MQSLSARFRLDILVTALVMGFVGALLVGVI